MLRLKRFLFSLIFIGHQLVPNTYSSEILRMAACLNQYKRDAFQHMFSDVNLMMNSKLDENMTNYLVLNEKMKTNYKNFPEEVAHQKNIELLLDDMLRIFPEERRAALRAEILKNYKFKPIDGLPLGIEDVSYYYDRSIQVALPEELKGTAMEYFVRIHEMTHYVDMMYLQKHIDQLDDLHIELFSRSSELRYALELGAIAKEWHLSQAFPKEIIEQMTKEIELLVSQEKLDPTLGEIFIQAVESDAKYSLDFFHKQKLANPNRKYDFGPMAQTEVIQHLDLMIDNPDYFNFIHKIVSSEGINLKKVIRESKDIHRGVFEDFMRSLGFDNVEKISDINIEGDTIVAIYERNPNSSEILINNMKINLNPHRKALYEFTVVTSFATANLIALCHGLKDQQELLTFRSFCTKPSTKE